MTCTRWMVWQAPVNKAMVDDVWKINEVVSTGTLYHERRGEQPVERMVTARDASASICVRRHQTLTASPV